MNLHVFFFTLLFLVYPYFATKDPPEKKNEMFVNIALVKKDGPSYLKDKTLHITSTTFEDENAAKEYLELFKTIKKFIRKPVIEKFSPFLETRGFRSHSKDEEGTVREIFRFQLYLYLFRNPEYNVKIVTKDVHAKNNHPKIDDTVAFSFNTNLNCDYGSQLEFSSEMNIIETCLMMAHKVKKLIELKYPELNADAKGIAFKSTVEDITDFDLLPFLGILHRRLKEVTFARSIPNVILAQKHDTLIIPFGIYSDARVMEQFRAYYEAFYEDNDMKYFVENHLRKNYPENNYYNGYHNMFKRVIPCLKSIDEYLFKAEPLHQPDLPSCNLKTLYRFRPTLNLYGDKSKSAKSIINHYHTAVSRIYANLLPWLFIMEWVCSKRAIDVEREPVYLNGIAFAAMKAEYLGENLPIYDKLPETKLEEKTSEGGSSINASQDDIYSDEWAANVLLSISRSGTSNQESTETGNSRKKVKLDNIGS